MTDLMKKNKHLTIEDRMEIHECLNHNMTFKAISKRISKDQTTVSKEVKRHLLVSNSSVKYISEAGNLTETPPCPKLLKAPFVCNPCEKRHRHCPYNKQRYDARHAQKVYETLLVESREGIALNKKSFYEMDAIVSKRIKQGQHLYHIANTHDLGVSQSTVYRHLHRGYFSISKVDFPRVVKFKPRRKTKSDYIPKEMKCTRTYNDFLDFTEQACISSWVEMDTVIGRIGGKALLTMDFTFCNFMIGILLENKTSIAVTQKINELKAALAANNVRFGDVFPLLLTDNGGEFANVFVFENTIDGEQETRLFFCDPMQSCQKPRVEKNHTLFRDIVPKGETFDHFTQDTVNLIFSHVNSIKRKSLNGKSPYELFAFAYGEKLAGFLGIRQIPASQVIQSPKLLKF